MYRLIAIVSAETGQKIEAAGRIAGERVTVIAALGLGAVLLPARKAILNFAMTKKAQLEGMLQDQRSLEALQNFGPLLPAVQGVRIVNALEALGLIAAHADGLRRGLAEYGAARQFQITIGFNDSAAIAALKDEPSIRAAAAQGPEALRDEIMARRAAIVAEAHSLLAKASIDRIDLPLGGEGTVLNLALLVGPGGEAALDEAVNAIDALLSAALSIKFVGPLPAVSFAAVTIEKPDRRAIQTALKSLGLKAVLPPQDLRAAWLAKMRQSHPDLMGGGAENGQETASYRLLARLSEAENALRRSGAAASSPLLLELRRDGDARRAA
jgi:hypothetical protein